MTREEQIKDLMLDQIRSGRAEEYGSKQIVDAILTALESSGFMIVEGWKPTAEAPLNESVLVFIPNAEHYGPGVYRAAKFNFGTGERWSVNGLHMGKDCGPEYQPVAWMPLPPLPKEDSDA